MCGGTAFVPEDREKDFIEKYSFFLERNDPLYVVERRTPVFKFIMDLDFYHKNDISSDFILLCVKNIQEVIREFFGDGDGRSAHSLRVIFCTTQNKKQVINNSEYIKEGKHLIWPELFVDQALALTLRHAILFKLNNLKKTSLQLPSYASWEKIVDESIYIGNGLRMIGSRKVVDCPSCKVTKGKQQLGSNGNNVKATSSSSSSSASKAQNDHESQNNKPQDESCSAGKYFHPLTGVCIFCADRKRVDEGRVYMPSKVYDGDNVEDSQELSKLLQDTHYMIKETSIRTAETSLPVKPFIPDWYFPPEKIEIPRRAPNSNPSAAIATAARNGSDGKSKNGGARKSSALDSAYTRSMMDTQGGEAQIIMIYVKESMFLHPKVIAVYKCSGKNDRIWYDAKTDSRYCLNIGGNHKSCTVYYRIQKRGMNQKCFCRCDTLEGRKSGKTCTEFEGPLIFLPKFLVDTLFPSKKKRKKPEEEEDPDYRIEREKAAQKAILNQFSLSASSAKSDISQGDDEDDDGKEHSPHLVQMQKYLRKAELYLEKNKLLMS